MKTKVQFKVRVLDGGEADIGKPPIDTVFDCSIEFDANEINARMLEAFKHELKQSMATFLHEAFDCAQLERGKE